MLVHVFFTFYNLKLCSNPRSYRVDKDNLRRKAPLTYVNVDGIK